MCFCIYSEAFIELYDTWGEFMLLIVYLVHS